MYEIVDNIIFIGKSWLNIYNTYVLQTSDCHNLVWIWRQIIDYIYMYCFFLPFFLLVLVGSDAHVMLFKFEEFIFFVPIIYTKLETVEYYSLENWLFLCLGDHTGTTWLIGVLFGTYRKYKKKTCSIAQRGYSSYDLISFRIY